MNKEEQLIDFTEPGSGFSSFSHSIESLKEEEEDIQEQEKEETPLFLNRPSVVNQFEKYPDTISFRDIKYHVFDLMNKSDRDRLAEIENLAAMQDPPVLILQNDTRFHESPSGPSWKTLLKTTNIYYKNILPIK